MVNSNAGEGQGIAWIRHHANYDVDFCLVFPLYRLPNGYGTFSYLGKIHYAHRFMCELVNGPPPSDEYEAAHSCGNGDGGCCNPKHLSWKTKSQNRLDALAHGTGVRHRGGNKGSLTPEQVMQIRDLKGKKTQADIALQFGISEPRVRAIFTGKIYNGNSKVIHWKPEEVQQLREGIAAGKNFFQIAREMGRKAHNVSSKAYRLGLKSGQPPTPRRDGAPRKDRPMNDFQSF